MKNLKLSSKLILLTLILCLFLAITGYVGWASLRILNSNTIVLGQKTFSHLVATDDIRAELFNMIRAQKNAVLSNKDDESNKFATQSEEAAIKLKSLVSSLQSDLMTTRLNQNSKDLSDNLSSLIMLNKQCLDMARLNTNVKAEELLTGKFMSNIELLSQAADKSMSAAKNDISEIRVGIESLRLSSLAKDLFASLMLHIRTPQSSKGYAAVDTAAKQKRDAFFLAVASNKDPGSVQHPSQHPL